MEIETKELKELAIMVNKTMHSVEFSEDYQFVNYAQKTLRLLDSMDEKYQDDGVLRSLRGSINNMPENRMQFYKTARDLLRKVNAPNGHRKYPSNVDFTVAVPGDSALPFRMSA